MTTTPSQTVGPYFAIGLAKMVTCDIAASGISGERITIQGLVIDGDGLPIPDAVLETWQANSHGKYNHPEDWQEKPLEPKFRGWGRIPTDASGAFRFTTIKPGAVRGPGGTMQAPHIIVAIGMRGLLKHLVTRIYFSGEPANDTDAILKLVDGQRRSTLIASQVSGQPGVFEWNVVCQGENETVFFDY
jgi:protocatechuate 3,4-dioxygenase, alpha subunit